MTEHSADLELRQVEYRWRLDFGNSVETNDKEPMRSNRRCGIAELVGKVLRPDAVVSVTVSVRRTRSDVSQPNNSDGNKYLHG
jgi:hypothetical protein